MVEEPRIADVVAPEVDTIHPEDPIRTARRRMEAQTRRSLVVVEEDRPIGVVQWRDIMSEEAVDAEAPVRDYMVREIPILTASMSLSEARERLTNVDIDRLPVVDEGGRLVGEVPRSTVTHSDEVIEDATVEATAEPTMAEPGAPPEAEQPTIGAGMTVNARAGKKLGTVDQVIVDPDGALTAISVQHGFLRRKHKRIPADLIDRVEGDQVVLSIDQMEFNMLPNVEDED